jgi:hypothetical protein
MSKESNTTKANGKGEQYYPSTRNSQFYLTTKAVTLLDAIARKQGLRRAAVLENLIRAAAKEEGILTPAL